MSQVHVSRHPLLLHLLARLRDQAAAPPLFRVVVHEMTRMLFCEAAHDLQLRPVTARTPLADCPAEVLADRVGLFPILRAGLGMADAILDALPEARVWHLGLYRDHDTIKPVTYYHKLPARPAVDASFVLDPMLATGGSAVEAVRLLKERGVPRIKFLALIAAPEGVHALTAAHPDVPLYLAAVDSHLDEHSYIIPGLGDAGDRQFGTA